MTDKIALVSCSGLSPLGLVVRAASVELALENDNIVKCYEIYEDNSFIHFVLELLQGGDLFDHIINSPNRKLDENEVMLLLRLMA